MDETMAQKQDNRINQCEPIQVLLAAHALGDEPLDAPTRAHLLVCPACQKILQEYRSIVKLLPYTAPEASPSAALRERLIASTQAEADARNTAAQPTILPTPVAQPRQRRRLLFGGWSAFGAALIDLWRSNPGNR